MKKNEFELIETIKRRFAIDDRRIIGIGDDAAKIAGNKLITTDAIVDGVHFIAKKVDFDDLGYKSLAVNISDIAAMGGYPEYAVITMGIPSNLPDENIDKFMEGVQAIRDEFAFEVVGGDTVRSETFFVSVTMVGELFAQPLTRDKARHKDILYVSGSVGDSAIGLHQILGDLKYEVADPEYFIGRHYCPTPRVKLIEFLVKHYHIRACIDISDGLLGDLMHISRASNVGFFLEIDELPLSGHKIGDSIRKDAYYFYEMALNGGEDYELLFTSPDEISVKKVLESVGVPITPIGYIDQDVTALRFKENRIKLEDALKSYQHF